MDSRSRMIDFISLGRFGEVQPRRAGLSEMATDSWGHREDSTHLRDSFPVVQSIREDTQGQYLHPINCFLACLAIAQHPRKVGHFCQPAAILFLLDLNRQWHDTPRFVLRSGGVVCPTMFRGFPMTHDAIRVEQEQEEKPWS